MKIKQLFKYEEFEASGGESLPPPVEQANEKIEEAAEKLEEEGDKRDEKILASLDKIHEQLVRMHEHQVTRESVLKEASQPAENIMETEEHKEEESEPEAVSLNIEEPHDMPKEESKKRRKAFRRGKK